MASGRDRDTHHTVAGGILDALGRGFLIATAGLVAGLMFGTAHLASLSLWTVAVAAAAGAGCMVGSALVRNAGFDDCGQEEAPPAAGVGKVMAASPAMDAAPGERWARRVARTGRRQENGTGTGRSV
jgi:hypothetical protein